MMYHYPLTCQSSYALWKKLVYRKNGFASVRMHMPYIDETFIDNDINELLRASVMLGDLSMSMELVKRGADPIFHNIPVIGLACSHSHFHIVRWVRTHAFLPELDQRSSLIM